MKNNLAVGMTIKAIDPCVMKNGYDEGKPALTIGKHYEINHLIQDSFYIVDDFSQAHSFPIDAFSQYFTTEQPKLAARMKSFDEILKTKIQHVMTMTDCQNILDAQKEYESQFCQTEQPEGGEGEIENRKVIFQFKATHEMFGLTDKDSEYADMAEEYAIVEIPGHARIMLYGKFNGEWKANTSGRFAIRYLLENNTTLQSRVLELEKEQLGYKLSIETWEERYNDCINANAKITADKMELQVKLKNSESLNRQLESDNANLQMNLDQLTAEVERLRGAVKIAKAGFNDVIAWNDDSDEDDPAATAINALNQMDIELTSHQTDK